ncbi:MAG: pyruvate kinase [Bacillota bacterium]|nr:pyruvate kinase [Bacillota bacterium]
MRKTKIICTLGPATDDPEILRELMLGGMNVARLNFSHGTHEDHAIRVEMVKKMREELGLHVALMLDTKGPEIRLGRFEHDSITLNEGDFFTLTPEDFLGTETKAHISTDKLADCMHPGQSLLIDDGLLRLKLDHIDGRDLCCKVVVGGPLSNNKSVNVPGIHLDIPYLSDKDVSDILFAIKYDFDFIAASFTRSVEDVFDVLRILEENGGSHIQVIAKIENAEGVDNVEDIIKVSDGIMVARGDMGVEIDFEELPRIQKLLIKKTHLAGKKCITATQMLDSMIKNPRPTRAETTDVANAIYDGTSAIMLSGETSIGKYPVESLQTMCKIAERTEADINYKKRFSTFENESSLNVTDAISLATCATAHGLGAAAIITVTKTGKTARLISRYRPAAPIIGCTPDPRVARQLSMSWGVTPLIVEEMMSTDELFDHAVDLAMKSGYVKLGDLVVLTAGVPLGVAGTTNLIKVHTVGHVLVKGLGISKKSVIGKLCVCNSEEEAVMRFSDGDILVIPETSNAIMKILKRAGGIITEKGGAASHAATVGLVLDIPVICGAEGAVSILKNGATATVDASHGLVYNGETKV